MTAIEPDRRKFIAGSGLVLGLMLPMRGAKAMALITWPDWQKPHCGTSIATQAFCTASAIGPETPSIVVTVLPATVSIGVIQDRRFLPSR